MSAVEELVRAQAQEAGLAVKADPEDRGVLRLYALGRGARLVGMVVIRRPQEGPARITYAEIHHRVYPFHRYGARAYLSERRAFLRDLRRSGS